MTDSSTSPMRSPDQLRTWAEAKYRAGHRKWLGLPDFGRETSFIFPLHPPSSSLTGMDAVSAWITTWRRHLFAPGVEADIKWRTVTWRGMGRQELPRSVSVHGAGSIAKLAKADQWVPLVAAASRLRLAWPDKDLSLVFPKLSRFLIDLDEAETTRLVDVVNWLAAHPESGLLPRELPIAGVDGKWLERHRSLVELVKEGVTDRTGLGLAALPMRFSVRVLDSTVPGVGAHQPQSFGASVAELNRLPWQANWVLVVENYETLAALPPLPGVVAVFGKGNQAVELASVSWVKTAHHLLYWGDLDTHGFRILGLFRQRLPQAESVLMDEDTLQAFSTLAVVEPKPVVGPIGHLTQSELAALAALRAGTLRLEQERISMAHARNVIERRLRDCDSTHPKHRRTHGGAADARHTASPTPSSPARYGSANSGPIAVELPCGEREHGDDSLDDR